jgi:hypothetical protein
MAVSLQDGSLYLSGAQLLPDMVQNMNIFLTSKNT